jgi:hypothetical protein
MADPLSRVISSKPIQAAIGMIALKNAFIFVEELSAVVRYYRHYSCFVLEVFYTPPNTSADFLSMPQSLK